MKERIAILTDSSSSVYAYKHSFDNIFVIDMHLLAIKFILTLRIMAMNLFLEI